MSSTATPEDVAADLALAAHLRLLRLGSRMPSATDIGNAYGVPRPTAEAALARLGRLGVTTPGPGRQGNAAAPRGDAGLLIMAGAALCSRLSGIADGAVAAAWDPAMKPHEFEEALGRIREDFLRAGRGALRGQPIPSILVERAELMLATAGKIVGPALPWQGGRQPSAGDVAALAWPVLPGAGLASGNGAVRPAGRRGPGHGAVPAPPQRRH